MPAKKYRCANDPWYKAQKSTRTWLNDTGVHCRLAGFHAPYDVITDDGKRIEVKYSEYRNLPRGSVGWEFNIARHNKLNESEVDAYVLNCAPTKLPGFKIGIRLVLKAPIRHNCIVITVRSMMTYWGQFQNRIDIIKSIPPKQNHLGLPGQSKEKHNGTCYAN